MNSKRHFVDVATGLVILVWSILLLLIISVLVHRNYQYANNIALESAKTSVNKDLAYRSWVASHGGVYVPVTPTTQPSPYLAHIKNRDFRVGDTNYTLMNGAYTLAQMMKEYSKLYGVKTHITSQKLLNPKNRPDEWEVRALEKVAFTQKQYSDITSIQNKPYLRLMNPLFVKKSCLKCHASQGYKVGDLRGGVSVSIPMEPLYNDAFKNSLLTGAMLLVIWGFGIVGILYVKRKITSYIDEKEHLYEEYIYGFVNIVEKRDSYTAGHSKRVAEYAQKIAQQMQLSDEECHRVYKAGMLHDVGKVAIPDSVFLKPTKLTEDEYHLIQEHVTLGYEMLKHVSLFDDILEIVRDHHEHFDGSGYPRGLLGDEIPLLAQILTVADAFDAMTTDRIYKGRKTVQEALKEIAQLASKQFHPDIAQAAIEALKDVQITHLHHQNPQTLLEKERFSYFYRDPLTALYNEYYLRSQIHNIKEYNYVLWISLQNFHSYNKKYGWSQGDALLMTIAKKLRVFFAHDDANIYRLYGDNFFISYQKEIDVDALFAIFKELLQTCDTVCEIQCTRVEQSLQIDGDERLEDLLKKLF